MFLINFKSIPCFTHTLFLGNLGSDSLLFVVSIALIMASVILLYLDWRIKKQNQANQQTNSKPTNEPQPALLKLKQETELLNNQLRKKTIELAKQSKENNDKNRLIVTLYDKLIEIDKNPSVYKIRKSEMKRLLEHHLESETNTFEVQIDDLNQTFFKNLKEKYPQLSVYDLRLSAYLKIGLTSKEIADIMQVLPSSINVSRSRLRKKLNLQPDDDLFEFMNQIEL